MARKPRRRGLAPPHAAARREAREQLAQRDRLLQQWLTDQLAGDRATAHLVWWVGTLHAGLTAWTAEARDAHVLPVGGTGSVSGTADQDRAMLRALAPNLDAADLEDVRGLVLGKLIDLASWYRGRLNDVGKAEPWPSAERVQMVAGWVGDVELAHTLERCIRQHAALKSAGDPARRKAAEKRWRDLAKWYVRRLDGGPT